mgnify:CR=1 FL=1
MYATRAFLNDFNPANLSNPSSLQINSQPVAEGAGGRGEALEYIYIYIYISVNMHMQINLHFLIGRSHLKFEELKGVRRRFQLSITPVNIEGDKEQRSLRGYVIIACVRGAHVASTIQMMANWTSISRRWALRMLAFPMLRWKLLLQRRGAITILKILNE